MERRYPKVAIAIATALGLAMTAPAFAADSGGNTNSKTNDAVKRSEGLPAQNDAPNTMNPSTYHSGVTTATGGAVATTNGGSTNAGMAAARSGQSFSKTGMSDWANDYATAHQGRITRQAYMDEMSRRWQGADRSNQGLTPAEVSELYGNVDSAAAFNPNPGSVQAGNMGPGSAKAQ